MFSRRSPDLELGFLLSWESDWVRRMVGHGFDMAGNEMKKGKHSFIHDVKIAKPCPANWDNMTGDERVRFCHQCKLNVYNISEMTTDEAEKLIVENEDGRLCLRLYRRKDGTVITQDCPKGLAAFRKKLCTIYGAVAAAVFAVLRIGPMSHEWTGDQGQVSTKCYTTTGVAVMGDVATGRVQPSVVEEDPNWVMAITKLPVRRLKK